MTGAGDFRTRLLLQAPIDSADGQGGVARSYDSGVAIWARVTALAVRENVAADADGASVRLCIETRAPLSLSLAHRLIDGAKVYRIAGFRDDGRIVTIDAELRTE